ncbi:hypothetical protein K488DRAFT_47261, partial [Vararia minispora EC-137]
VAPMKFLTMPLGEIRPSGWLYDQLMVQTNGLAGHQHDFYDLVAKSDWIGGDSYYSYLEEAGSYWFNAMVPNGVLVGDQTIMAQTQEFLDYVLDHQDESGWLGPEVNTTKPRLLWGRYPFFFGAIQMTEYNTSLTARVVNAFNKFIPLANKMLHAGEGVDRWAATRWEDFVLMLQWMYDNGHSPGQEKLLLDTMRMLKSTGDPWELYFPPGPAEDYENPFEELTWHGVNMAEGLKALPATYRFTHNQSDLDRVSSGWDLLFKYHGRPSGAFAADEMLAGLEAARGTELCLVVVSFHGSYLYQVTGEAKYADRVERMAYNALPATLTGDMWARQYLQEQNQVAAKNMTPNPFPEDGPYSNVFGLEPNYPCCTVNFPQGWPKFVTNAFVMTPDGESLVHLYLGPFRVHTVLSGGNAVNVSVDTLYPFTDIINTTISARKAFTYLMRIPSWVVDGTISINGQDPRPFLPVDGLLAVEIGPGVTSLQLNLPAEITIEERPHGSVAVHRGPINYAFDIPRVQSILHRDSAEPRAVDYEMEPSGTWQYAIDPSTLVFHQSASVGQVLPSPIFDAGQPPNTMSVQACPIEWALAGDTFAAPPPRRPTCVGPEATLTLWPYGATKLRISEFPTFTSERALDAHGNQVVLQA